VVPAQMASLWAHKSLKEKFSWMS